MKYMYVLLPQSKVVSGNGNTNENINAVWFNTIYRKTQVPVKFEIQELRKKAPKLIKRTSSQFVHPR